MRPPFLTKCFGIHSKLQDDINNSVNDRRIKKLRFYFSSKNINKIKLQIRPTLVCVFSLMLSCVDCFGQKKPQNSKVVLISVDGAVDWILDDLLARNVLSENGAFSNSDSPFSSAILIRLRIIICVQVLRFALPFGASVLYKS